MAREPYNPTSSLPRMGTEAYRLGSVRQPEQGQIVSKAGNAKGGVAEPATARSRRGIPQGALGPQYRITAKRTPYNLSDAQAPTQANGRIVPSAIGVNRNFRANW